MAHLTDHGSHKFEPDVAQFGGLHSGSVRLFFTVVFCPQPPGGPNILLGWSGPIGACLSTGVRPLSFCLPFLPFFSSFLSGLFVTSFPWCWHALLLYPEQAVSSTALPTFLFFFFLFSFAMGTVFNGAPCFRTGTM